MSPADVGADPAVRVSGVSKTFVLPLEPRKTVREYVVHPLRRTKFELQRALENVTFSVRSGEFFGVIGRNGSGKSTLLKILAGIYAADRGKVEVAGAVSPFIELGVGFHPELNARDNVRVNGTLLGLTERQVEERFGDIIAFAELERFVDQKLKNYSSGMQVRLAFSVAIQVPFDILLLDEVLAVGDQSFQEKCFETFKQIRDQGKTIILVTHNLGYISQFCDRAMLLEEGEIAALGPADEVVSVYLEQEQRRAGEAGHPPPNQRPEDRELARLTRILTRRHYRDAPLPPAEIRLRMSRTPALMSFLSQGLRTSERVVAAFGESPREEILEWGCFAGRTLRWLLCYEAWHEAYRGCDPDEEANAWVQKELGFTIEHCELDPALPYEDGSFAGIFGFNMLTHIHPLKHAGWYEELHRVIRPNAVALVGTLGPSLVPPELDAPGEVARSFRRQGWAFAEYQRPVRDAAFVSERFTRACVEGLFEVDAYEPRALASVDIYALRRVG